MRIQEVAELFSQRCWSFPVLSAIGALHEIRMTRKLPRLLSEDEVESLIKGIPDRWSARHVRIRRLLLNE